MEEDELDNATLAPTGDDDLEGTRLGRAAAPAMPTTFIIIAEVPTTIVLVLVRGELRRRREEC